MRGLQVQWKAFWVKGQRYRTLCVPCIARRNERERNVAMGGIADEDLHDEAPDWGPVYLSAASRAILMAWHRKARDRVFGRAGTLTTSTEGGRGKESLVRSWLVLMLLSGMFVCVVRPSPSREAGGGDERRRG